MSPRSPSAQEQHTAAGPLEVLSRRRDPHGEPWIGPSARMAAERFAVDLMRAGMVPRVTMEWSAGGMVDRSRGGPGLNASEAALAARQRADLALKAVGPDFAGVLIDVCGFEKGLEVLERERNWPVRSGKLVVRYALNALARHYGYADAAVGPVSGRRR
jgi:hypothetical protein